jgi:hypothetical protein
MKTLDPLMAKMEIKQYFDTFHNDIEQRFRDMNNY